MDVDLIFKIAAIGLAGLIVVLMMIIVQINTLFETVKSVFGLY